MNVADSSLFGGVRLQKQSKKFPLHISEKSTKMYTMSAKYAPNIYLNIGKNSHCIYQKKYKNVHNGC